MVCIGIVLSYACRGTLCVALVGLTLAIVVNGFATGFSAEDFFALQLSKALALGFSGFGRGTVTLGTGVTGLFSLLERVTPSTLAKEGLLLEDALGECAHAQFTVTSPLVVLDPLGFSAGVSAFFNPSRADSELQRLSGEHIRLLVGFLRSVEMFGTTAFESFVPL